MMSGIAKIRKRLPANDERGQAAVFLVLALGIFLIGGVGFVVDGANLWFHRQTAQTAADAACTAGAMDMLSVASGVDPATLLNSDWLGTLSVSCPSSGGSICSYAGYNGYSSQVTGTVNNTGLSSISTDCDYTTHSVCAATDLVSNPYLSISLNDPVATTFMRLVGAGPSVNVPAHSICGLSNVLSYVPVLVLNPNSSDTIGGSGTLAVTFSAAAQKTPTKLLQVNSTDSGAVSGFGGTITLTNADESVGNFAIAGQSALSGGFTLVNAAGITTDPFALVQAPAPPAPGSVSYRQTSSDCPGGGVVTCDIYWPGHWSGDLTIAPHGMPKGSTTATGVAVFQPGIYYFDGSLFAGANTCLRPALSSTGSKGVVFYFHTGTLQVGSGSGQLTRKGGAWSCQTDAVYASTLACPSASTKNLPPNITGNVLLGPCEAPNGDTLQPYGDPLGQTDPNIGEQRGMLLFQDRESTASPTWSPSGSFGLIGNIYIHHCGSGSGSGANCDSTAFDDIFTLGGGTGYIVGDIVVDKLAINSGSINVSLNPNPQYYVLKASLLQ